GDIDCPTLVICGSEDQLTPPKYSQFLVEQIADASLVLIPNAGHMVMLEQPEQVGDQILDFLRVQAKHLGR
ncbi:MAG: alpha/beta hydrolase, partial [Anaerolineales bacterium]